MKAAGNTNRFAVGGFIAALVNQYWVAYHVTIAFAVLLVWEILLLPETQYPRASVVTFEQRQADTEARGEGLGNSSLNMKRTTQLPWLVRRVEFVRRSNLLMLLIELPKDPRRASPQAMGNSDNILQTLGLPKIGGIRMWIHFL